MYRLLHKPVPEELFVSNISTTQAIQEEQPPTAWLSPTIDGEATSYFEWLGAGIFEVPAHQGAMHQTGSAARLLTRVLFGFSASHLFVRLDGDRRLVDLLAEGHGFSLTFLHPSRHRLEVEPTGRATWSGASGPRARIAAGTVLELAVPLQDLEARAGDPIAFFVSASRPAGPGTAEAERYPAQRAIQIDVPGDRFSGDNWRA